jgi:hypothetical protein
MDDSVEGYTLRRYWKGHYLGELTDEAIDAFVERGTGVVPRVLVACGPQGGPDGAR